MSSERRGRPKRSASGRLRTIEEVHIEKIIPLSGANDKHVGECCYISTTINSRRYYGLIVDQESLKEASDLHFQDQASSLQLNKRMEALQKVAMKSQGNVESTVSGRSTGRQVQKFMYCPGNKTYEGYREILATYANVLAASEDDLERASAINKACESGGNWVGKYYYQYEVASSILKASDDAKTNVHSGSVFHTSMSFTTFLLNTPLPAWHPLKNIATSRKRIMNMFNMKFDSTGTLKRGEETPLEAVVSTASRTAFRIGIVGAGLGGLSCAQELLRLGKKESIDIEVKMFEARDRVGGRCATDKITFKRPDGTPFPIDLGAAWIHGTTGNPLTLLARDAKNKMTPQGTGVKMLVGDMKEANGSADERVREIFDDMLERGAKECWAKEDLDLTNRRQMTTRFYAALLHGDDSDGDNLAEKAARDVALHRYSSDTSVGLAVNETMTGEQNKMTVEETRLLKWNIKHTEYSFGANLSNLSMRYWDADEDHALEGKHVVLKDGYSSIAESIRKKCEGSEGTFELKTNYPVEEIHYDIKCFAQEKRSDGVIGVSDSCKVSSKGGSENECFDFIVCALPLGILKESTQNNKNKSKVSFIPKLPESKIDAIEHMGFGILNKVYIQFPYSFWRKRAGENDLQGSAFLSDAASSFGNASSVNPHHYLFYDVGFDSEHPEDPQNPSILYTLMSGNDAVKMEHLSDKTIIEEVMTTLRHLFSGVSVPTPIGYKISRWASDQYSRGSYSFLAPGSTEEDYIALRSPVCGSGDDFSVGKSETMRLFFAGEHTSLQYPSMTHGAYVSGIRAAQDVFSNIQIVKRKKTSDEVVPISRFRMNHPSSPLVCSLCRKPRTEKEGALIAFRRGKNGIVLIHSNCAEYSPDVNLNGSNWHGVLKCINRGRQLRCVKCGLTGGTIGCSVENCMKNYHVGCVDSGWDFETDGKDFYCLLHRDMRGKRLNDGEDSGNSPSSPMTGRPKSASAQLESSRKKHVPPLTQTIQVDKVRSSSKIQVMNRHPGLEAFRKKYPLVPLRCFLCNTEEDRLGGTLIPYVKDGRQALVHQNCQRYTNIVKKNGPTGFDIFDAIRSSKSCIRCNRTGATIKCNIPSCEEHYHFSCAISTGWNFDSVGALFLCPTHGQRGTGTSSISGPQNHSKDVSLKAVESTPKHNEAVVNGNKNDVGNDRSGDTTENLQTKKSRGALNVFEEVTASKGGGHLSEARVTKMGGNENPLSSTPSNKGNMIEAASTEASKTPLTNGTNSTPVIASGDNSLFAHDLFHQGGNTCNADQNSSTKGKKRKRRNYGPTNEFDFRTFKDQVEETSSSIGELKHDPTNREGPTIEIPTSTTSGIDQVEVKNTNESTGDSILKTGKKGENVSVCTRSETEPPVPTQKPVTETAVLEESTNQGREPQPYVDDYRSEQSEAHDDGQPEESLAEEQEVITIDDSSSDSGEEWVNNLDSDSEDGLSMFV